MSRIERTSKNLLAYLFFCNFGKKDFKETASLRSKRFLASSSRKLGREQKKRKDGGGGGE